MVWFKENKSILKDYLKENSLIFNNENNLCFNIVN